MWHSHKPMPVFNEGDDVKVLTDGELSRLYLRAPLYAAFNEEITRRGLERRDIERLAYLSGQGPA